MLPQASTRRRRSPRVEIICAFCGRSVFVKASRCAVGKGRYCNRTCYHAHKSQRFGKSLSERFWSRVDTSDDCWVWIGAKQDLGYGIIEDDAGVTRRATHVAWEVTYGSIPDGMRLLHRCDNPPCVRPDHLFLGTQADNVDDMIAKGRNQHGETAAIAKLTEANVIEIRRRVATGTETRGQIAADFGICVGTISDIAHRKSWKHLP